MDEVGLSCTDADLLISKVELLCDHEAVRAWIAPKTHQQHICVMGLVYSVYHSACKEVPQQMQRSLDAIHAPSGSGEMSAACEWKP